jgi:hypothetical protein
MKTTLRQRTPHGAGIGETAFSPARVAGFEGRQEAHAVAQSRDQEL